MDGSFETVKKPEILLRSRRGGNLVKSNMVHSSVKTWYTTYSLEIDR